MKRLMQAGVLLILLALPAFIVFMFFSSSESHYGKGIRRYYPVHDSTTGAVQLAKKMVYGKEIMDTVFHTIPPFNFTNQEGKPFSSSRLEGKIHVADFFFTRCPGICKKMSSQMIRVQEHYLNNSAVEIVSFSVDPENDTIAALKTYANLYQAQAQKWNLLTGDKSKLYALAKFGYKVTAKENDPLANNLEDQFVHTDKFVMVDRDGYIRGYYDGTNRKEVDRMMTEIDVLLREYALQP